MCTYVAMYTQAYICVSRNVLLCRTFSVDAYFWSANSCWPHSSALLPCACWLWQRERSRSIEVLGRICRIFIPSWPSLLCCCTLHLFHWFFNLAYLFTQRFLISNDYFFMIQHSAIFFPSLDNFNTAVDTKRDISEILLAIHAAQVEI